ncbi:MAG: type II secretion system F family protein [Gammaproteobacteria bacterium]|nr:type II secretion system F family protein [Gammaproteobacteria bacterium]
MYETSLTLEMVFSLAVLSIGICVLLLAYLFQKVTGDVERDERDYMDPLPPLLALIWPLVLLVANSLVQFHSNRYLDQLDSRLQKTGVSYMVNAEQFVAMRYVGALIAFFIGLILIMAVPPKQGTLLILLGLAAGGFMFPLVWLSDTRKRREKQVIRTLPVFLDFITMSVEAGLNLTGAVQQAMNKGPDGPLKNEFNIIMRDIRSGVTRAEAMKRMAARLDIPDITSFVNAMVQAERMGSSMAKTLRLQSEQRRTERFQRAEKQAMQAPVKLIFPLVAFIFPVTFIVLGFPIMMKFMAM